MSRFIKISLRIVLVLYCLVLVKFLILDRIFYLSFSHRMYNFYPFKSVSEYFLRFEHYNRDILIKNLAGNLLMLSPLGVILPVMFEKFRKAYKFITFILIFNLSIEIFQIVTTLGSFDIDDIILNSTGALITYGFIRLILRNQMIIRFLEQKPENIKHIEEKTRII
ncbi:glycopeptide antibiotics resistance protein [Paenibacillus sp. V4I9]|uniref:VanZ family protein n=1 Tax=Paenibacillus sp. V4I9 TaxID=3042308 RepID=UPI0027870BD0|nr:VanZ family protein [Paenibacillus sp. V4I9]MDQ0887875.1 glycopeptide antibiotics resistance protein [Paenibacillus sp. V4I9]